MLELPAREAHVWCVGLDVPRGSSAELYATLSADERARSARFRFEHDRQRFIAAHGALRDVLSRYLDVPPGRIGYSYNVFGKPALAPEFAGPLNFNLSHSGALALIAIAAGASVGVDVERVRAEADFTEVAGRFFSTAEAGELQTLPEARYAEGFMRFWTRREACVKARGRGFAADGASDQIPSGPWLISTLNPAPGYIGALAVEGSGWRVGTKWWGSQSESGQHICESASQET